MHDKAPGTDKSLSDLEGFFWASYPDADKTIYAALFNQLRSVSISDDVGRAILDQINARKAALKLSEAAFRVSQGHASLDDLQKSYEALTTSQAKVDHALPLSTISTNLQEIVDCVYKDQGLRWRLNALNKSLGSLRDGDFGFIFARPETGKTTFLASECSEFINQATRPIVWLNNEEDGRKVMMRVYQAYFGITLDKLLSNVRRWQDEFQSAVGDKFYLFDSAQIGKRDVEKIVEQLDPALLIYDQMDKIKGFQNDREDLRLGSIYQWGRELAKGSHAAIGVCQADGTAEGVRKLTMEHVANAKTAKQAEADWILGIGKHHGDGGEYARYLNICKNKLLGDKDSIPEFRHGFLEVKIEPTIARYLDVLDLG